MTDKEITKALECHTSQGCADCPYDKGLLEPCIGQVMKDALDLINRQQAKIKRLEMDKEQLEIDVSNANCNFGNMELLYKDARAEAIKEFKCELIEQIEYIEDAHQAEYKDDFGKGWMAGFNTATHLITGAIGYIADFENRGEEELPDEK